MNYAALIFLLVIAWSTTQRPGSVLVLLLASMPFASLALLPPGMVGGMSLLPQFMFAIVLISKVLIPELLAVGPKLSTALRFRNLGYLALFYAVGTVATVIMPRLFQDDVVILPMRESWIAAVLSPSQANFTQWGYVTLSVMTSFTVAMMADRRDFTQKVLDGVLAGAAVCVATGLIDFAAAATGTEGLLAPFRNAEYAYLTEVNIGGIRRVVGFTPEASTYGSISVQFAAALLLLRHLYEEGRRRNLATTVTGLLLILAVLSTSSTAYLGLAVLGLVYAANGLRRIILPTSAGKSGLVWELIVGLAMLIVLLFISVIRPDLFNPLTNLVDEVIFNKPLTSSFFERSHWNAVAWDTVAASWGLGVGFGSTRTSNWFVSVISNTGLIGATVMGIFLVQTFTRRLVWSSAMSAEVLAALKLSLFPVLAMFGVAAPGPDFGPWVAVVFGAIAGIAIQRPAYGAAAIAETRSGAPLGRTIRVRRFGWRAAQRARDGEKGPTAAPRPSF